MSLKWLKLTDETVSQQDYINIRNKTVLKYFIVFWIEIFIVFGLLIWMIINKVEMLYYFLLAHIVLMMMGFQVWHFYCTLQANKRNSFIEKRSIEEDSKSLILPPPSYRDSINRNSKNSIFTPADDFKDTWNSNRLHSAILPFDQEYQLSIMIASPSKALNTKLV